MDEVHGSPYSEGERCRICGHGVPGRHKVGEEDARPDIHNYTAYLCCGCFGMVMGKVAQRECEAAWAAIRASEPEPGPFDGMQEERSWQSGW